MTQTSALIRHLRTHANFEGHSIYEEAANRLESLDLPSGARKIMKHIRAHGPTTTANLSDCYLVTSQNASTQLNRLHKRGYLRRVSVAQDSGGYEYSYTEKA